MSPPRRPPAPIAAALDLMRSGARPAHPDATRGWLDLLGDGGPAGGHVGRRLLAGTALPPAYDRWLRPVGGRLLLGPTGPGPAGERALALEMLGLSAGDRILDVGCGTGALTRALAAEAGRESLVVGLDASSQLLDRAVAEPGSGAIGFVRGDAAALPFADGTFDAVGCFGALHLLDDPVQALDELVRVLAPGGRVALLASVQRGPAPFGLARPAVRALTGAQLLRRRELTDALRERGLRNVRQRVAGLGQFVAASRPVRSG